MNYFSGTGVTVNAVHPGIANTNLERNEGVNQGFFSYFAPIFVKPLMWCIAKSPVQASENVLYLAADEDLKNVSGKYFV